VTKRIATLAALVVLTAVLPGCAAVQQMAGRFQGPQGPRETLPGQVEPVHAAAIAPEGAVLVALLACLLVDLAGERPATRWVPPICYAGLLTSLVLLALQWNGSLEPSFLGAFLADNLAIAFRAVVAASTLITLLLSWRYVERSGTPVGEYAAILLAATLGAMVLCGATDLISIFISLETLSVSSYLLSGYMKRDARSSEAALKYLLVGSAAAASNCTSLADIGKAKIGDGGGFFSQ
jgi:NAD(P)H-quinone oxidoreductase subunit 2